MLYIETDFSFEDIKRALQEVYPSARPEHIVTDYVLKQLGFVDYPPCIFSLDMTWNEYEEMMDELMQLEIDAFNTPDGKMPAEDDPAYQRYGKYGWLWDMFYNAKIEEREQ